MSLSNTTLLFYIYTLVLLVGPIGCLLYLLFQLFSQYKTNGQFSIPSKKSFTLLIVSYIIGTMCGILGFTLHLARQSGQYCALYGIAICFMFNGANKSIMYYIFVERAKIINGGELLSTNKRLFFDYLAPIYITIHWFVYVFGTFLLFKGENVNPLSESTKYISYCVFADEPQQGIFILAVSLWDVFNCATLLYVFIVPLRRMMRSMKESISGSHARVKSRQLMNVLKWNVILSCVATVCSAVALTAGLLFKNAIWASCMADPLVNCSCAYFMMRRNRSYCIHIGGRCCRSKPVFKHQTIAMSEQKTDVHDEGNDPKLMERNDSNTQYINTCD
eukprot:179520_1